MSALMPALFDETKTDYALLFELTIGCLGINMVADLSSHYFLDQHPPLTDKGPSLVDKTKSIVPHLHLQKPKEVSQKTIDHLI